LCGIAAETVRWLREHAGEVYGAAGHLHTIGQALKDGLIERGVPVVGQPERSALNFANDADWLAFCSAVIDQGVMLHRPQFPTLAHTIGDVEDTLTAVDMALAEMQYG
jgi:hypothetical protein